MTKPKNKEFVFRITGDHPHTGETCIMSGKTDHTVTMLGDMALMTLLDCQHGVEGCYVSQSNLRLLTGQEKRDAKVRLGL